MCESFASCVLRADSLQTVTVPVARLCTSSTGFNKRYSLVRRVNGSSEDLLMVISLFLPSRLVYVLSGATIDVLDTSGIEIEMIFA